MDLMHRPSASTLIFRALRLKCPRCGQTPMFTGLFRMQERCSHCELKYEREPGYFVGSLYVSYAIACVFFGVGIVAGHLLLPHWDLSWFVPILVLLFLPLAPTVARYARVIWLYFDHWAWPAKLEKMDSDRKP